MLFRSKSGKIELNSILVSVLFWTLARTVATCFRQIQNKSQISGNPKISKPSLLNTQVKGGRLGPPSAGDQRPSFKAGTPLGLSPVDVVPSHNLPSCIGRPDKWELMATD